MLRRVVDFHIDRINGWAEKRGVEFKELPPVGWITDHAALFIVETNSIICFAEPLVTNPDSTSDEIAESLDILSKELFEYAKRVGYDRVYAMTKYASVVNYASRYNFKEASTPILLQREL